jgi:hypothetical protein
VARRQCKFLAAHSRLIWPGRRTFAGRAADAAGPRIVRHHRVIAAITNVQQFVRAGSTLIRDRLTFVGHRGNGKDEYPWRTMVLRHSPTVVADAKCWSPVSQNPLAAPLRIAIASARGGKGSRSRLPAKRRKVLAMNETRKRTLTVGTAAALLTMLLPTGCGTHVHPATPVPMLPSQTVPPTATQGSAPIGGVTPNNIR